MVVPITIGSTTAGLVFLEVIRRGISPAAVIVKEIDTLLATGGILAECWFDEKMAVVEIPSEEFWKHVKTGDVLRINSEQGVVEVV